MSIVEIKPCPACHKAPTWGTVDGILSLCCDCDGIGFEPLQDTPQEVLNKLKAAVEEQWNEAVEDAKLHFAPVRGKS